MTFQEIAPYNITIQEVNMDNNKSQYFMFGLLTGLAQTKIELDDKVCGLQRQEVEKCSKVLQDA